MNDIKNTNTNIQQIIFPVGYELRKIEKKPKKKKGIGTRRKKALSELKTTLQQYDTVINEAKENNISLPKELGELPLNINEINTINEIESLTADLRERIAQIAQMISKETTTKKAIDMFKMPQRAGLFPSQPNNPFNFVPTVIPRPNPFTPSQPVPVPVPSQTDNELNDTDSKLDEITKEIESKLSPEQRESAIAKRKELLEKQKQEQEQQQREQNQMGDEDKDVPTSEKFKVDNFRFRMLKPQPEDVKILGEQFIEPMINATRGNPNSGTGLYDKFRQVRLLIEKIRKKLKQDKEDPDEWILSKKDASDLKSGRDELRTNYEFFISKLDSEQAQSINSITALERMDQYINKILSQPLQITATDEINQEMGRTTARVLISDFRIPTPRPPMDADNDEPDRPDAASVETIMINPAPRKESDMTFFDTLLDFISRNKDGTKSKNYSKTIITAVKNMVNASNEAEDFIIKKQPKYKKKYQQSGADYANYLKTISNQKTRNDKISELIFYWEKVTGSEPFSFNF